MTETNAATDDVPAATIELTAKQMHGQMMTFIADRFRNQVKVYKDMSEGEQGDLLKAIDYEVGDVITQAIRLIAQDGRPTIVALVEQITIKDGIKAVLTLEKSNPLRHELADSAGREVLVVVAPLPAQYAGGERPKADPAEPGLPLGEEMTIDEETGEIRKVREGEKPTATLMRTA